MGSHDCGSHQLISHDCHTCHDCEQLHRFHVHDNDYQHYNDNEHVTQHDHNHGDDHVIEHGIQRIDNGHVVEYSICHHGDRHVIEHSIHHNHDHSHVSEHQTHHPANDVHVVSHGDHNLPENGHIVENLTCHQNEFLPEERHEHNNVNTCLDTPQNTDRHANEHNHHCHHDKCKADPLSEHQTPRHDNHGMAGEGHNNSPINGINDCDFCRTSQTSAAHVTKHHHDNHTKDEHNNKDSHHGNGLLIAHEKHDFDLVLVLDALRSCPLEGDDVALREYLVAYNELCRFFKLTGRLFGFVAKDLEGKISVIEKKMDDKLLSNHYTTVKTMVCFEKEHSMTFNKGHRASGSRTLLRLHWAFEFILEFMQRLSESSDQDKTSLIASEVYHKTLSNHHPWITRKMAALAMYLLPSRKDLIGAMCKQDYGHVIELLGEVVQAGKLVYASIEDVFAQNNILHIP